MAWWYSQDEERWNGPCDCREDASSEGRGEYDEEPFMVLEAETGDYDMRLHEHHILEALYSLNEDRMDPDGDYMLADVTKEKKADLVARVNAAISDWVVANFIGIRAWGFIKQGIAEDIPGIPVEAVTE